MIAGSKPRSSQTARSSRPLLSVFDRALCLSFARVVGALGGENRLHWVLDVIFPEDLPRFRTGDGRVYRDHHRTALNLLSHQTNHQSEEP